MKKYTFKATKILYADMKTVVKANSYKKALEIAEEDAYYEENWEEIGIGESERIDSNNIRCENEKGEK
jgi:hypothetical protein